ncbi:MAG TPA: hypothetical protein PK006_08370 [Saprospiraceae bacterium]|nr:hypothetical protein [Saprospiraceae bacterium]
MSIYLMGATPLVQLFKIPQLIQHYNKHLAEDQDLTLKEFLVLHYFNENPFDDDYNEDMKLPFKQIESSFNFTLYVNTTTQLGEFFNPKIPEQNQSQYVLSSFVISNTYLNSIWQPPRQA